jgi:hypothetical protein
MVKCHLTGASTKLTCGAYLGLAYCCFELERKAPKCKSLISFKGLNVLLEIRPNPRILEFH